MSIEIEDVYEMIYYFENKVLGVVDFANAQGLVIKNVLKPKGPLGPSGFEILPICGLL